MIFSSFRGIQKVLLFIIPYFLVVGAFQYVGILVANTDIKVSNATMEQMLIIQSFSFFGTLLLIFFFVNKIFKDNFLDIGFHSNKFFRDSTLGGIFVLVGILSVYLYSIYADYINYEKLSLNYSKLFQSALLFLMVAISEEILFRGYLQKYLMQSLNKYLALLISSLVFALMHALNPNVTQIGLFSIFCGGLIMGYAYIHTQSIWFPISVHFWWNFVQNHIGYNVSGIRTYSLISISYPDYNIWNGGSFGFEGSILSFIAEGIILVGFVFLYKRVQIDKV